MMLKITLDPNLAPEKYEKSGIVLRQEIYCVVKSIKKIENFSVELLLESAATTNDETFCDPIYAEVHMDKKRGFSFYASYELEGQEDLFRIDLPCLVEEVEAFPSLSQLQMFLEKS